jgi:hypothetical protein
MVLRQFGSLHILVLSGKRLAIVVWFYLPSWLASNFGSPVCWLASNFGSPVCWLASNFGSPVCWLASNFGSLAVDGSP